MAAFPVTYFDTHVVVWLYRLAAASLSSVAIEHIEMAKDLRISPMVRLELQYLHERGRLKPVPGVILDDLQARVGLSVCRQEFSAVAIAAERVQWTRDPFDRIIVAQALLSDAPLLTKDKDIRRHYSGAVW